MRLSTSTAPESSLRTAGGLFVPPTLSRPWYCELRRRPNRPLGESNGRSKPNSGGFLKSDQFAGKIVPAFVAPQPGFCYTMLYSICATRFSRTGTCGYAGGFGTKETEPTLHVMACTRTKPKRD